jgi:hypothetical protein
MQLMWYLLEASVLAASRIFVVLRKYNSYDCTLHLMFYPRLVTDEADEGSFIGVSSVRASGHQD